MPNTHPRVYEAEASTRKFTDALFRLNEDPEYTKKVGMAVRPLARLLATSRDDNMILQCITDAMEVFAGDPELTIQDLMSMLDTSLTRLAGQ